MKSKPITPYARLLKECKEWAFAVAYPHRPMMYRLKDARTKRDGYTMHDVYERVAAADTLGYDVHLRVDGNDLLIEYVRRPPDAPWAIRP